MHAAAASAAPLAPTTLPAPLGSEAEPNEGPAQASPVMGDQRIRASLAPAGDVDYYVFEAHAGDRVFANVVTAGTQTAPADPKLWLLQGDSLTALEEDDNDGSHYLMAPSIAGTKIETDGLYYLRIEDTRGAAAAPAPYDLYFALRSGAPAAELEPNGKVAEANVLTNGEVSGVHSAGDEDYFSLSLQAGDTVFLSLDLDPDRGGETFNGRLGFGPTGDTNKKRLVLTVDDPEPGEPADSTPPSEAQTITVSKSGSYYAYVDSADPLAGGLEATYDLAVSVFPATQPSCRRYPYSLPTPFLDGGTTVIPIQVDDVAQVARAAIRLDLEEGLMSDLDVFLRSPAGLEQPLFTDIGSGASDEAEKRQTHLEAIFDDYAAIPPRYPALSPLGLQAKAPLAGFAGQQAQGTWTLVVKDDTPNFPPSVGSLTAAELVLCPQPGSEPAPPAAPAPPLGAADGNGVAARPQAKPAQPPVLSDFTIAPGEFRAAKAGPMVRAKRSRLGGALVSYQSTEAAQTNLILFELEEGRKVGGKCVRPTAVNSARKPCVRPVKVISFIRNDVPGRNQFGFTGRVGARKLPPGEYQLQARAYAGSGLTSAPVSAPFTVLPPAAKETSPRQK